MEKKNLKANDFNMDEEIKKVQTEYLNEIKAENGIIDLEDITVPTNEENLDKIASEKNEIELERLKNLNKIKKAKIIGNKIFGFIVY